MVLVLLMIFLLGPSIEKSQTIWRDRAKFHMTLRYSTVVTAAVVRPFSLYLSLSQFPGHACKWCLTWRIATAANVCGHWLSVSLRPAVLGSRSQRILLVPWNRFWLKLPFCACVVLLVDVLLSCIYFHFPLYLFRVLLCFCFACTCVYVHVWCCLQAWEQ